MTNSDFHVYHEEGNWRVVRFEYTGGSHDYVEHRCLAVEHWGLTEWTGFRYTYSSFHLPCARCKEMIPVNLQTTYVLLTGDMDMDRETWVYPPRHVTS